MPAHVVALLPVLVASMLRSVFKYSSFDPAVVSVYASLVVLLGLGLVGLTLGNWVVEDRFAKVRVRPFRERATGILSRARSLSPLPSQNRHGEMKRVRAPRLHRRYTRSRPTRTRPSSRARSSARGTTACRARPRSPTCGSRSASRPC